MGDWSEAMADGVICEGCALPGNTATCGCPESQALISKRLNGDAADGGKVQDDIMRAVRNRNGVDKR